MADTYEQLLRRLSQEREIVSWLRGGEPIKAHTELLGGDLDNDAFDSTTGLYFVGSHRRDVGSHLKPSASSFINVNFGNQAFNWVHDRDDLRMAITHHGGRPERKSIEELRNWCEAVLTENDLNVIRVSRDDKALDVALRSERFTHESLRRSSRAVMLFTAITQVIYLATGAQLVAPAFAAVIILIAASFYIMSLLMKRDIEKALRVSSSNGNAVRRI